MNHNNIAASLSLFVLWMAVAGCSPASKNSQLSTIEKVAHERELAAIAINTVVRESTNHSVEDVIENNPEAKVLEACANPEAESLATSLFAPVFEAGNAIALETAAAQSSQGSPGSPLTKTEVEEIARSDVSQILGFYCQGWLEKQTVSPIH